MVLQIWCVVLVFGCQVSRFVCKQLKKIVNDNIEKPIAIHKMCDAPI